MKFGQSFVYFVPLLAEQSKFYYGAYRAGLEYLLLIEVQIAGEKSSNDFIKIYNPTNSDLDISGYKLRKRTSTGSESSINVLPKGSRILSKSVFLWVNSEGEYASSIGANVKSKATIAKNNSIALLNPEGKIIDALAWGKSQNPFVESSPFPENPSASQKLERKQTDGIYQDTNNNVSDFYLNPPSKKVVEEPAGVSPVRENFSNGVRELAAVGPVGQIPETFLPFIVALPLAIFSGLIILILKSKPRSRIWTVPPKAEQNKRRFVQISLRGKTKELTKK